MAGRAARIGGPALLAALAVAAWLVVRSERSRGTLAGAAAVEDAAPERAPEPELLLPRALPVAAAAPAEMPRSARVDATGLDAAIRTTAGAAAPIRGRVLDQWSKTPMSPHVVLDVASADRRVEEKLTLDSDGTFATQSAFPGGTVQVAFALACDDTPLGIHRQTFEPGAGEWTIELDPGVIVPLVLAAPNGEVRATRARIVEQGPGAQEWKWVSLDEPGCCLRYAAGELDLEPDAEAFVEVDALALAADVEFEGRARLPVELGTPRGIQPPLVVPLRASTFAVGRVVDASGGALEGVTLWLCDESAAARSDVEPRTSRSDAQGRFRLSKLAPGTQRLRLALGYCSFTPRWIEVRAGRNDLGTIAVALPEGSGAIRGEVRVAGGLAFVLLKELGGAERERRTHVTSRHEPEGVRSTFAFEHVPPGSYVLRPLGFYQFVPESVRVSPPSDGIVFEVSAEGPDPSSDLEGNFTHFKEYFLLGSTSLWPTPMEREVSDGGWGLRVFCGDADDAAALGGGELDPRSATPLAGVRVLADGKEVATSDARGFALATLEREPARLDFALAGSRVAFSMIEAGVRCVLLTRE